MAESKLRSLAVQFAVDAVKYCDTMNVHRSLVNQLERSATSIGANIHEANYAHGKADFIAKLQIALKECYETEYYLYNQCGTIRRRLISSITTAKENA